MSAIVDYVEKNVQGFRVAGTRVSLDSVVYAFLNGQTAEAIAQSFPALTLEQVYGAIAFYLANRHEIDEYLARQRAEYEAKRQAARDADPMFYQKLADARHKDEAA
ncbi:MAG: hypothetical protein NVSMB56_10300 [Pyrinomonadaceae bacterium]